MAASIASYISSGVKGAKVIVAENAKLMFHAPWTGVQGSKDQLRDTADLLEKMEDDIMAAIVSRGAKEDRSWMAAGRAKWLSAKEAVAAKLADEIGNPPTELLESVASFGDSHGSRGDEEGWDSASAMSGADRYAAACSIEGYAQALAEDRFGEGTVAQIFPDGTMKISKKDGSETLLKYRADSHNILDIDWESASFETKQENHMNEKEKAEAALKAKEEADAKLKAEADAKAKADADAKAKADAEALALKAKEETDAKLKAEADAKAKQLPEGMTPDMVAFAQKNYQAARDLHIAVIKAAPGCIFTDAELADYSIEMLAKMAKIAEKPGAAAKTDNSIVDPSLKPKGNAGSLPPPEN
jgi:hypothetical protein